MTRRTLLAVLTGWLLLTASTAPQGKVDFSRDILPILSDNCFHCHGPDAKARKADLRLDTKDGALREDGRSSCRARAARASWSRGIDCRRPDERDAAAEGEPQADAATQIDVAEAVDRRGRGVGQALGVRAAAAPGRADGPKIATASRNPIDAFVLARLEKEGLTPSPEARQETLHPPRHARPDRPAADARRGRRLPRTTRRPTPTRRSSTGCSPRRATASGWPGTGSTPPATPTPTATRATATRTMWPWRDWVVEAFNANMPFDRFTV